MVRRIPQDVHRREPARISIAAARSGRLTCAPHSHAALDCEALTDASYATLTGEDWSAEEASGDLVVDVELPGDMPSD